MLHLNTVLTHMIACDRLCGVGWLVIFYGPSTISSWDQSATYRLNSHPVPKSARAKVKRPLLPTNRLPQGIEPGTTESVDREDSPEPPAPLMLCGVIDERTCRAIRSTRPQGAQSTYTQNWTHQVTGKLA